MFQLNIEIFLYLKHFAMYDKNIVHNIFQKHFAMFQKNRNRNVSRFFAFLKLFLFTVCGGFSSSIPNTQVLGYEQGCSLEKGFSFG